MRSWRRLSCTSIPPQPWSTMLRARIMPLYVRTANRIASAKTAITTIRAVTSRRLRGCGARVGETRGDGRCLFDERIELGRVVAVAGDRDDEVLVLDLDQHPVAGLVETPDDELRLEQQPHCDVRARIRHLELVVVLELGGLQVHDPVRRERRVDPVEQTVVAEAARMQGEARDVRSRDARL